MIEYGIAGCMKGVENFGYNTWYDICAGTHTTIPWGFSQWVGFGLGATLIAVLIFIPAAVVYSEKKYS